ncbi:SoxR reducing system RseC family protein [Sulfuricystis multivorans]|uniref:SoxR reducing system RseC family protein n=1 Tax=Sulfuricystis multivorans TaxID=2211108 RepID=UPI000F8373AA|nr:SoxR reducing system RseC family protein [Sulfuricystis multivorans]
MNRTDGIVVRLEGRDAWVETTGPGNACGGCAQAGSCPSCTPGNVLDAAGGKGGKLLLIRLPNTIGARPGDAVVIRAADGMVLRAVWLAYGIPLLLALGGALLATALTGSEPAALIGMLLGLMAGIVGLRWWGLEARRREPILSLEFKTPPVVFFKDRESC